MIKRSKTKLSILCAPFILRTMLGRLSLDKAQLSALIAYFNASGYLAGKTGCAALLCNKLHLLKGDTSLGRQLLYSLVASQINGATQKRERSIKGITGKREQESSLPVYPGTFTREYLGCAVEALHNARIPLG